MKLTYIFHSGFVLETEQSILVFDYWLDPSGVMEGVLQSNMPLYVFSSHFHEDHFTREIFEWKRQKPNITYILSKDILRHRRANKEDADVWLAKGGSWSDGRISVKALGSTDSGVSWIVETEDKLIFHAGDLNNWYARFLSDAVPGQTIYSEEFEEDIDPIAHEKQYLGELKDIRKVSDSFDLVMFPIDGRIPPRISKATMSREWKNGPAITASLRKKTVLTRPSLTKPGMKAVTMAVEPSTRLSPRNGSTSPTTNSLNVSSPLPLRNIMDSPLMT